VVSKPFVPKTPAQPGVSSYRQRARSCARARVCAMAIAVRVSLLLVVTLLFQDAAALPIRKAMSALFSRSKDEPTHRPPAAFLEQTRSSVASLTEQTTQEWMKELDSVSEEIDRQTVGIDTKTVDGSRFSEGDEEERQLQDAVLFSEQRKGGSCIDQCYAKQHQDVSWADRKCTWANCADCTECSDGQTAGEDEFEAVLKAAEADSSMADPAPEAPIVAAPAPASLSIAASMSAAASLAAPMPAPMVGAQVLAAPMPAAQVLAAPMPAAEVLTGDDAFADLDDFVSNLAAPMPAAENLNALAAPMPAPENVFGQEAEADLDDFVAHLVAPMPAPENLDAEEQYMLAAPMPARENLAADEQYTRAAPMPARENLAAEEQSQLAAPMPARENLAADEQYTRAAPMPARENLAAEEQSQLAAPMPARENPAAAMDAASIPEPQQESEPCITQCYAPQHKEASWKERKCGWANCAGCPECDQQDVDDTDFAAFLAAAQVENGAANMMAVRSSGTHLAVQPVVPYVAAPMPAPAVYVPMSAPVAPMPVMYVPAGAPVAAPMPATRLPPVMYVPAGDPVAAPMPATRLPPVMYDVPSSSPVMAPMPATVLGQADALPEAAPELEDDTPAENLPEAGSLADEVDPATGLAKEEGSICDLDTEVSHGGKCYYLDGSGGDCDDGYELGPQSVLAEIGPLFVNRIYKHHLSTNCCILHRDQEKEGQDFGMFYSCDVEQRFRADDIMRGGRGCKDADYVYKHQLTLCQIAEQAAREMLQKASAADAGNQLLLKQHDASSQTADVLVESKHDSDSSIVDATGASSESKNTFASSQAAVAGGCDDVSEVSHDGNCYYLDGSGGKCDTGYGMAPQSVLRTIGVSFVGKTYRHHVSDNCCIKHSEETEGQDWGMQHSCDTAVKAFQEKDVIFGGRGCRGANNHYTHQLTLCVSGAVEALDAEETAEELAEEPAADRFHDDAMKSLSGPAAPAVAAVQAAPAAPAREAPADKREDLEAAIELAVEKAIEKDKAAGQQSAPHETAKKVTDVAPVAAVDFRRVSAYHHDKAAKQQWQPAKKGGKHHGKCPTMFVAVMSKASNSHRRSTVREMYRHAGMTYGSDIKAKFVICTDTGVTSDLRLEANTYSDLLFLACDEGHAHGELTRKVTVAMQEYLRVFGKYEMFMKTDDDTFVSHRRLCSFMQLKQDEGKDLARAYMGVFAEEGEKVTQTRRVNRDKNSDFYEPYSKYSDDFYPVSARGGPGYILSKSLVKDMVDGGLTENALNHEGRSVGLWVQKLQKRGEVNFINIPGTNGYDSTKIATKGQYKDYPFILHHHLQGDAINCLHKVDVAHNPQKWIGPCFPELEGKKAWMNTGPRIHLP